MQYFLIGIFWLFISDFVIAQQSLQFVSSSADRALKLYKKETVIRTVTIRDHQITVTNYLNNNADDLTLDIRKIEKKNYLCAGISTWYYGKSASKDGPSGAYILIVPESKHQKRIILQQSINNVVTSSIDINI